MIRGNGLQFNTICDSVIFTYPTSSGLTRRTQLTAHIAATVHSYTYHVLGSGKHTSLTIVHYIFLYNYMRKCTAYNRLGIW